MASHPGILSAAPEAEGAFRPPQHCQASLQARSLLSSPPAMSSQLWPASCPNGLFPDKLHFLALLKQIVILARISNALRFITFHRKVLLLPLQFFFLSKGELWVS